MLVRIYRILLPDHPKIVGNWNIEFVLQLFLLIYAIPITVANAQGTMLRLFAFGKTIFCGRGYSIRLLIHPS
jgi:hypothetical protein